MRNNRPCNPVYGRKLYLVSYTEAYDTHERVVYTTLDSSVLREAYEHNENCRCNSCNENGYYVREDVKVRSFRLRTV
jgi:hypothetical protein